MYSPKLNPELVVKLYQLKQKVKRPMTDLVNEAVTAYLNKKNQPDNQKEVLNDQTR